VLTVIRCYQMSSEAIRSHQNASRVNQKHSKIHQRYVKMHQKTPVFFIKYCHNKELNVIGLRITAKKSKIETNMNGRNFNDQNNASIKHFAPNMRT